MEYGYGTPLMEYGYGTPLLWSMDMVLHSILEYGYGTPFNSGVWIWYSTTRYVEETFSFFALVSPQLQFLQGLRDLDWDWV